MRSKLRFANGFVSFIFLLIAFIILSAFLSYLDPKSFIAILFDKILAYLISPFLIGASFVLIQELWKLKAEIEDKKSKN